MDNASLAIILMIIALCLLGAEVFIPSGGMILITALVCLAGSIFFAWRAWSSAPIAWWSYVATLIVLVPSVVGGMLYWFPRTTMGKRILLDAPELAEMTPYEEEVQRLNRLIGHRGKSMTLLNPGGMVIVDGERHHCESQSLMIEPGEDIEVVGVSGTRLVVRQATSSSPPPEDRGYTTARPDKSPDNNKNEQKDERLADDWPLDFDVPHG